jgi:cell division protein FtsW (lipid II flippase)
MFVLVSLGLLIGLGLVMIRPISPSIEGLQAVFNDKSYASFLIETILITVLAALVTASINYFLFRKTAKQLIKKISFLVVLTVHIIVALKGSIGYIKIVTDNVY